MADYNNLAQIEKLYAEQAILAQAIDIFDHHHGTVPSFGVSPVVQAGEMPSAVMSVTVVTTNPGQNLMAACRASCNQRYNDINQELKALGVTNTPPNQAGGPG
jgi:hypothetical protein